MVFLVDSVKVRQYKRDDIVNKHVAWHGGKVSTEGWIVSALVE